LKESAEDSLGRLLFDTITHSPRVLEFLIDSVGPNRVLLGSDYPYDMGNLDCVARVEALSVSQAARNRILGGRARELLGFESAPAN
jgi:aminocarboxymuconate-semialdehyde decarboxylase